MNLDELSNETRMIATPWSRMVRGLGLGQHPIPYDPIAAARIRESADRLADRVPGDPYTAFARRLSHLILSAVEENRGTAGEVDTVLAAVRRIANPYYRATAGAILMDSVAKLRLDPGLLVRPGTDVPAEMLSTVDRIEPDRIRDENSGRHGDYERLSAFTAVFLAHGQLGLTDRLVDGPRNYLREALGLLGTVPSPFFRGRGGAMLLSVVALLGHGEMITDGDHVGATLRYLEAGDGPPAAFPQPMSPAFEQIYPLVTMLNAVAATGAEADRLGRMRQLWAAITPVERTHMGLYYLIAVHNLGRRGDQIPDLDAFVASIAGQWREIDPGADFFRSGIAYPYLIETALIAGRPDLIPGELVDRLADSFPDLDRTGTDRVNRPYPFSYAVTALAELGAADVLFTPRARYAGQTPMNWVIDQLSPATGTDDGRLYTLNHALLNYALRLRGPARRDTGLFRAFTWAATAARRP